MSARPKARHVHDEEFGCAAMSIIHPGGPRVCSLLHRHAGPHNYAPAPQEKGAEEPGPRTLHDENLRTRRSSPATVPLPLSLVERIESAMARVSGQSGKVGWPLEIDHPLVCNRMEPRCNCGLNDVRSVLAELRTYVGKGGR